jgi:hypothetical protein
VHHKFQEKLHSCFNKCLLVDALVAAVALFAAALVDALVAAAAHLVAVLVDALVAATVLLAAALVDAIALRVDVVHLGPPVLAAET